MGDDSSYSIIGFYVVLMILLNLFSVGYGESFVRNADFLDEDLKSDMSGDVFATLNFLLLVNVPESSNIANAIYIYRFIYLLLVFPYTVLIAYIIARLIRGGG